MRFLEWCYPICRCRRPIIAVGVESGGGGDNIMVLAVHHKKGKPYIHRNFLNMNGKNTNQIFTNIIILYPSDDDDDKNNK